MSTPPATAVNTRSGRILDFANPDPASIDIDDVAGGLAMAPRFGGQALEFHSVAQHAVNVAMVVAVVGHPELDLAALHHDSHEAYACDIPRPLKQLLKPSYSEVTDRLDRAIAAAFAIEWPESGSSEQRSIKAADDAVFIIEAEELLAGSPLAPDVDPEVLEQAREVVEAREHWDREKAESLFKSAHRGSLRSG